MTTILWRGDAVPVAQVSTATITGDDATTTYKITINGKVVSVLGTGSGVNATASALKAALASSTIPEFQEVTWTVSTATITGTAATPGVPFTATSSVSGGAGTIGAVSTTAGQGPNDWSVAANWSTGVIPANGDDVYIQNSTSPILYGLAQSGVALNSINGDSTFTGTGGLPRYNPNGYLEYRPTYLAIGASTANLGTNPGAGAGSGRFKIDFGSGATVVNVFGTGSPADPGLPALIIKGTNITSLNCQSGSIGVAIEAGNVSTITTVRIGWISSQATDVNLTLGAGCTLTTIDQEGGFLTLNSTVATLINFGGTASVFGSGTITTLDVEEGGTVNYWSSGTITTATGGYGSTLNFDGDRRTKIVTNMTLYGTLNDRAHVVTHTNPVSTPNGVGIPGGATVNWGTNYSIQRS